jgi:starch synthase
MTEKILRILYIASEARPFVKIGGLGDVAGTLPPILRQLNPAENDGWQVDIRLVIPYHREVVEQYPLSPPLLTLHLPRKSGDMDMDVFETEMDGMPVYLIDGKEISAAKRIYSFQPDEDMAKFASFSLAALELARQIGFQPHILNANDWHTALAVYALDQLRGQDSFFADTKSLFTVHNLPYMGAECKEILQDFGLSVRRSRLLPKWGRSFAMPLGLITADHINAVSPTYAREIQTPEFGCSLEDFLFRRADRISGIINGLDYNAWNPAMDAALLQNYTADTLLDRPKNKSALQKEFGLPISAQVPLFVVISRLDHQKGIDTAIAALRLLKKKKWQAIILGTGAEEIEKECQLLASEMPDRVRVALRFDGALARRMYAGGDAILLPSRYEPCGLTQLIGMRYGCVPAANAVGGFVDTIVDNDNFQEQTGFLSPALTREAFAETLERVLEAYKDQALWQQIQGNGMNKDYSWRRSARKYLNLYLQLSGLPLLTETMPV